MPVLTYELVLPLVARTEASDQDVQVLFRCPVSGDEVPASGRMTASAGGEVKRSLWRQARGALSRMMSSVFGHGGVSRRAADTAGTVGEARQHQPSEAELKSAVLDAFKSVGSRFAWDASSQRFVSASVFKELQNELAVIVQRTRITATWDRAVLARMLSEIAAADGKLAESERLFFHAFLPAEDLDELLAKAPLVAADLAETSPDVRRVMWLLAAAMAVSDELFDAREADLLVTFAYALGLSEEEQEHGLELAREYVLDLALESAYADGHLDKSEHQHVLGLATSLGISLERSARLDARCRKRKGIL